MFAFKTHSIIGVHEFDLVTFFGAVKIDSLAVVPTPVRREDASAVPRGVGCEAAAPTPIFERVAYPYPGLGPVTGWRIA